MSAAGGAGLGWALAMARMLRSGRAKEVNCMIKVMKSLELIVL